MADARLRRLAGLRAPRPGRPSGLPACPRRLPTLVRRLPAFLRVAWLALAVGCGEPGGRSDAGAAAGERSGAAAVRSGEPSSREGIRLHDEAPLGRYTGFQAGGYPEPAFPEVTTRSFHIRMRDGTRIAADLHLPAPLPDTARIPAIVQWTRYWRAAEGADVPASIRFFVGQGYAVLRADERGSGASFGRWPHPWSEAAIEDAGELVDWVVARPWSNGRVGGVGTSYEGTTAEFLAATGREAVKAVIPKFNEFDVYTDIVFPGGVFNEWFVRRWSELTREMDLNTLRAGDRALGVRRVDGDADGLLLDSAITEHRAAPDFFAGILELRHRDDLAPRFDASIDDMSVHRFRDRIEGSGAFIYGWGSWMDAATADAVLHRFMTFSNEQTAVVGPWSHGAGHHASPYLPPDAPVDPSRERQIVEDLAVLDRWLKGKDTGFRAGRRLVYYTMGEERWKSTDRWPPPGTRTVRWYLAPDGRLSRRPPTGPPSNRFEEGDADAASTPADRYVVDFEATTGTASRWRTQLGGGDVVYPDRATADRRLLVYDSPPLEEPLEVTGHPVVTLHVSSTATDGAFLVYLEDVAPDGEVVYLTEGHLRGSARAVSDEPAPYVTFGPHHSFEAEDVRPLVPGEVTELSLTLLPTSALFRAGHRIRIAIAGADADNLARIPARGVPVLDVHRSAVHASRVDLPVAARP